MSTIPRIAIFATGSGSNAEQIIRHFANNPTAQVAKVYCNKPDAGVIEKAARLGVGSMVFNKEMFAAARQVQVDLEWLDPQLIVLAGFLWKVPKWMTDLYPNRILNIHPALLPKYGGKGMYGMNVHQAVVDAKDTESGMTIHLVNEEYDKGRILYQAVVELEEGDDAQSVATKVLKLEHKYFPSVIESYLSALKDR